MPRRSEKKQALAKVEPIEPVIRMIRGQRVILDSDLAKIYGVTTKVLNQAVKRNKDRFPSDFMIRIVFNRMGRLEVANCDFKPVTFCDRFSEA